MQKEGKGAEMERYGKSDKHCPAITKFAGYSLQCSLAVGRFKAPIFGGYVHTDTLFMVVIIAGVLVVLYRTPPITPLPIQKGQLFIDAP